MERLSETLFSDGAYAGGISQILKWKCMGKRVSSNTVCLEEMHIMDSSDASVFDGSGDGMLTIGDIITIKSVISGSASLCEGEEVISQWSAL